MGLIEVTNPGLVEVENQGWPIVRPGAQALPPNLGQLLAASLLSIPGVAPSIQALPVAANVNVGAQAGILPSFSLGSAIPTPSNSYPNQQNLGTNAAEFIVAGSRSIQTNNGTADTAGFVVLSALDAATGAAPGATTSFIKVTTTTSTLLSFGVSLQGQDVDFLTGNAAGQSRVIQSVTANSFVIAVVEDGDSLYDSGSLVAMNDTLEIYVGREGFEAVFATFNTPLNVFLNPAPPVAATTVAASRTSLGNVTPTSGVVSAYIGSGTQVIGQSVFVEVENQVYGYGLPSNVNVH